MAQKDTPRSGFDISAAGNRRLDSWKEIASYLGRDVRTVIRWEKAGLPVHRVPGGKRRAVFAYPAEIEHWLHDRNEPGEVAEPKGGDVVVSPGGDAAVGLGGPRVVPHPGVESGAGSSGLRNGGGPRSRTGVTKGPSLRALLVFAGIVALAWATYQAVEVFGPAPLHITRITRLTHDGFSKSSIAADGGHVYFSERRDGKEQLSSVPAAGGAIHSYKVPFSAAYLAGNAAFNGNLLVRLRDGKEEETELWVVPTDGATPRRAGDVVCHSATWLDQGKGIAYSRGTGIFVTLDGGATSRELHEFGAVPFGLHWSNTAQRLRFTLRSPADLSDTPWEMEVGDDFKVRGLSLMVQVPEKCCGAWAETVGREFVTDTNENRLWAMAPKSHWWRPWAQRMDLPPPIYGALEIAADPQARRVYALSGERGKEEFVRFHPFSEMSAPFLPGAGGFYPDFSRDGRWVVYVTVSDATIWVARVDGREMRPLVSTFSDVALPRWSPDGAKIAFMSKIPGHPWRIYVVGREGGTPREIAAGTDNQGAPTWSADGKWLAYANVACEESQTCAVHRIEVATGRVETVLGSGGLRTARWSPNGKFIAALDPERHELRLFDVGRQKWSTLANYILGDDLAWSPDSKYLYSYRPTGDQPAVLRVPSAGGSAEVAVDLGALNKLTGIVETSLGVAPDGSIILSREISFSEIYALDWGPP